MIYPHIIWIGIILLSLGLYGVVKIWPDGGLSKTFSQHVASSKYGVLYYILLFTITLPIFTVFFFNWLIPTYSLSILFGVFILIALVAQYLCTLIPEVGMMRKTIHRSLAFVSALGLFLSIGLALFSGSFTALERVFLTLGVLVMAYLLLVLVITQAKHPKILYIQASYFAAFFCSILLVTYL